MRVAVIGAGVMGRGIAAASALAGLQVGLCDVDQRSLEAALAAIRGDLELLREEGALAAGELEPALARLLPDTRLEGALDGAGLVIETITEVLAVKHELTGRLERLVAPGTVIASNTSTLPLAALAQQARHPERLACTHFFNPAHLVPLVEVVFHPQAPEGVRAATLEFLGRLGKVPVVLRRDVPGFIANRLQAAVAREAFALLEQGLASAEEIDDAVTEGPGFRWPFLGPIATADAGGLDTWQRVLDNLCPTLSRATAAPASLVEHVRRGELGAKSGRGMLAHDPADAGQRVRERDRRLIRLLALKRALPALPSRSS
jgi:3-hydroxybutyryl-CoA dehydrogenase